MNTNNSETQLLKRLKEREDSAIKSLYTNAFKSCAKVVLKDGGTMEDAREIFQEAIYSLIVKLENPDFSIKSNVNAYLYRSCFNLWVISKRKARRYSSIDASPFELEDDTADFDFKTAQEERYNQLYACLGKASAECQQLLKLTYFEKKSDAEIAPIMNYSKGFVKNKRRRCVQALRACVQAT